MGNVINVTWNQLAYEMNLTNYINWDNENTTLTYENGVITNTWIKRGGGYAYAIRSASGHRFSYTANHIYYLSYMLMPDFQNGTWSVEWLGGDIDTGIACGVNNWSRYSITRTSTRTGNSPIYICNLRNYSSSSVAVNSTCKIKSPIVIDLTQMFGAGNEPSLLEFEYQCELNGIDLTQFHTYNATGTSRQWIKSLDKDNNNFNTFKSAVKLPLDNLTCYFNPIQSGTGDPSPSNIKPIYGWNGIDVFQSENLFQQRIHTITTEDGITIRQNGQNIKIEGTTTAGNGYGFLRWDSDGSDVYLTGVPQGEVNKLIWFIWDGNLQANVFVGNININNKIINCVKGHKYYLACTYYANQTYNLDFTPILRRVDKNFKYSVSWQSEAGTVYGGYVDLVSGILSVNRKLIELDGNGGSWYWNCYSLQIDDTNTADSNAGYNVVACSHTKTRGYGSEPAYSSVDNIVSFSQGHQVRYRDNNNFTDLTSAQTYLQNQYNNGTPVQLVVKLVNPMTYQLTPLQIKSLLGQNNIWSNTNGNTTVSYPVADTADMRHTVSMFAQNEPHAVQINGKLTTFNTDMPTIIKTDAQQGTSITRIGKNIYDAETYPLIQNYWINGNVGTFDSDTGWAATQTYIPISQYRGRALTLNKRPSGSNPGIAFYTGQSESSYIGGYGNNGATAGSKWTFYVFDQANYMRFCVPSSATDIQIELGSQATDYEPYQKQSIITGQNLLKSLSRINNIYSDTNDNLNIQYWTHNDYAPYLYTYCGIPVVFDNAYYPNNNGGFASFGSNSNFFITGMFDTLNSDSKSYTFTRYTLSGLSFSTTSFRIYKNLSGTSYDYWSITGTGATRTLSTQGRWIFFTVYKPTAADAYMYYTSNGERIYLFKGSNVA